MFGNLIESGSHAADLKRRGRFFAGTILFYALLLVATGVGTIYAYDVSLGDDTADLEVTMMRFPPSEARAEPATPERAARASSAQSRENQIASRIEISNVTPYRGDNIASPRARDINPRTPVVLGPIDSDPPALGGIEGPNRPSSGHRTDGGPSVSRKDVGEPPPAAAVPTPAPPRKPEGPLRLPSSVISGKAISMPAPAYPQIAKVAGIGGPVVVQLLIDEGGKVVSAKATSGHDLLQGAAVRAAYQARFSPTLLGGVPVKVTGVITYNFVLR